MVIDTRVGARFLGALLIALGACEEEDPSPAPPSLADAPPLPTPDAAPAPDAAPPAADAPPAGRELDIAVCDPAAGPFSLAIDNPFFPLAVGDQATFAGEEDGEEILLVITVLDETEEVGGVTTRVVEERERVDGELVEVSRNYFAQAPDGTVCYFGEAVDIFEDGMVSHEGAWRADEHDHKPGIIMPAHPRLGDSWAQEVAPGVAEDRARAVALGERVTVPAGTFTDTLRTLEDTPLEPGQSSEKVYAAGLGLLIDDVLERQP